MGGVLRALVMRGAFGPERISDGVWRVQGQPGRLNVYLIADGGGLVQFDAGGRCMLDQIRSAVREIGLPLREVVLGHGHTDHRGTAPHLGVPVRCHADEALDAEGSGGFRYWSRGLRDLPPVRRVLQRDVLHPRFWDGGPVAIAGTVQDGDAVAGFRVRHLPGHAPGQIALIRDADGVALTSDAFYTIDPWGRTTPAHLPDAEWNFDTAAARASLRLLAGEPLSVAWPGHGEPVRGDVGAQLTAAAR